jgi:hypothetical protein
MAQTEQQPRNTKAATYLALSGALGFVSTALMMPFSWPVIAVAVTVGALATNDKGRAFLKKAGDQLAQLGSDVVIHVTQDVNRLQGWWNRFKESRAQKQAETVVNAPEKPSAFKGGSSKNAFAQAAKPGAENAPEAAPAAENKAAPAAENKAAPAAENKAAPTPAAAQQHKPKM